VASPHSLLKLSIFPTLGGESSTAPAPSRGRSVRLSSEKELPQKESKRILHGSRTLPPSVKWSSTMIPRSREMSRAHSC